MGCAPHPGLLRTEKAKASQTGCQLLEPVAADLLPGPSSGHLSTCHLLSGWLKPSQSGNLYPSLISTLNPPFVNYLNRVCVCMCVRCKSACLISFIKKAHQAYWDGNAERGCKDTREIALGELASKLGKKSAITRL